MSRVLTLLVAGCLLMAGCLGEDADIFYGDDINPPVPVSYTHLTLPTICSV